MLASIGVIGLGKLGLPLAVLLAKHFRVYGVDVNPKRIQRILKRENFFEPHLNNYLEKHRDNLFVSIDYSELKDCDVVFILTQTPSLPSGKFDLQYVESALKQLDNVNPRCLAVVSSTINIGDMNKLQASHERVIYNPEFIRQGSIIHDFENPKFILIGAYDKKDAQLLSRIWGNYHDKTVFIVKPVEAEIAKLTLNVSYTLGITFANMIGELCRESDADASRVLDIIYNDRRNYKPGLGFMGPCFPRDMKCFQQICSQRSYLGHEFAVFLDRLNDYMVQKYLSEIKSSNKKKIGILGVAYKSNVPYVYESQPLKIAQQLAKDGFEVYIFDRLAEQNAKEILLGGNIHFCSTISECLDNAEVLFIGTMNYSKVIINPWR